MIDVHTETASHEHSLEAARRPRTAGLFAIASPGPLPPVIALGRALRIGRGEDADVVLEDAKASRLHASIELCAGELVVTDLASRNGTFVRGARITGPTPIAVHDVLRIGASLFVVVADAVAHRGAPRCMAAPLVGGASIVALRREIDAIGRAHGHVLIEGATGTGKEGTAALLHAASGREGPLVAVNCAAIPTALVESELFGHARGSFSGSDRARRGLLRAADGGTLFLDEVAELNLEAQAKLLRVLEDGCVRAVGEDMGTPIDLRVVAATHRSLDRMVAEDRFRLDLLHRLAAHRLKLSPLCERREDIALLVAHFLALEPGALPPTADALERLALAPWLGNVRELANALRSAIASARARGATALELCDLPVSLAPGLEAAIAIPDQDAVLRARLETALRIHAGNVTHVARDLAMRRGSVYESMKRLGIDPTRFRT
jgi:DNA-binding NtrC family response regulator